MSRPFSGRREGIMAVYKRGGIYWFSFTFCGKRIQESANTSRKTIALESEKNRRLELERALAGMPTESKARRIMSVKDLTGPYLERYKVNHRKGAAAYCTSCIRQVDKLMGEILLPDLTEEKIVEYMKARLEKGAAGRTINAELGELSRAIGKPWGLLWPRVKRLEERRDVGKALTSEQEEALLRAAELLSAGGAPMELKRRGKIHRQTLGPKGVMMPVILRVAMLTGMRAEEITSLRWGQVDFGENSITVGRSKTEAGAKRIIPMGPELIIAMQRHLSWWRERFGLAQPDLCVFPFGSPQPCDPKRPVTTLKHSWETVRELAAVDCRFHDLRHSFCTRLAEAGVPESTMLALMGHMSRAMLERYSHIRMAAKREAVAGLTLPKVEQMVPTRIATKASTSPSRVN
ncbi:MAG: site-specific integrase [Acidobacteria bacterium]|nr:site-specific integrase [Acidobacteriota bacterium]